MIDKHRQEQARAAIEAILQDEGLELVEFKLTRSPQLVVRCLVDYASGGVTIDDLARVNRRINLLLEDSNILGDEFSLEVSSPGLDRKLTGYQDFLRVEGCFLSLWLNAPLCGKQYWEGELLSVSQEALSLKTKNGILDINLTNIKVGKEKVQA